MSNLFFLRRVVVQNFFGESSSIQAAKYEIKKIMENPKKFVFSVKKIGKYLLKRRTFVQLFQLPKNSNISIYIHKGGFSVLETRAENKIKC